MFLCSSDWFEVGRTWLERGDVMCVRQSKSDHSRGTCLPFLPTNRVSTVMMK